MMRIAVVVLFVTCCLVAGGATPASADDLTVALSSLSTETLDPVLGGHIVKFYLDQIFDYLVGMTADGELSADGGIATRWESSADHKRWTFHLRRGVKFHNGDELTSEDAKFSLQRAMGKRSTTGYAEPLRVLIKDIETPAPDRIVIVTKEPTSIIPQYLSRGLATEGMIVPKKYLEAKGDDAFARSPVGSGPYRFVEQIIGSHIKLEAVPSHWRAGVPRYRTLTFRIVPEETTRIALLRRGDTDIIEVSRERVKELQRAGVSVVTKRQDAHVDFWWILPWTNAPIRDKRVREALNIAIDRAELIDSVFAGMAEPGAVPFAMASAIRDVKFRITPEHVYPYDPARAKQLLAEAGHANGFPMELYAYQLPGLPEGRAMAEALAGYWHKIGVQTTLVPVDYVAFRKKWFDRSAPGALGYYNQSNRDWLGTYAMIDKWTNPTQKSASINDPELDRLVGAVLAETDREKVNNLMRSIFQRLRSEHLGIPLVYLHSAYATSKKISRWNPGSVMYDLNIDELVRQR
jgi:peptide/nickel transport system substrate-binding protein